MVVLHKGEVVHRRGYGRAHLEWDAPITPATVFPAASLSKQFTALAVCLLAADGKLSLDDDVRRYMPESRTMVTITLRHLLHHTSGLHDATELGGYAGWRPGDLVTDRDYFGFAVRQKTLDFKPGDRHVYGNTNYVLAAQVVRKVSGQSLRAFCDDRVFKPLGMKDTHFHDDHDEVVKNRASAYAWRDGRLRIAVPQFDTVGSSGLFTTADDLVRWDRNFDDRKVGKSVLDQMITPGKLNSGEPVRYGRDLSYGLGLVVGRYRGLSTVSHSGADRGYRAEYLRFPDQRFSVIVLGNLESLQPYTLARRWPCLPGRPVLRREDRAARREGHATRGAGTCRVGRNLLEPADRGVVDVLRQGRQTADRGREVTPLAADRFRIGELPIELVFSLAKDGVPRRLTWRDVDDEVYEAVPELDPAGLRLEEYVGAYWSDEMDAPLTLSVRGGELVVRGRAGTTSAACDRSSPTASASARRHSRRRSSASPATGRGPGDRVHPQYGAV